MRKFMLAFVAAFLVTILALSLICNVYFYRYNKALETRNRNQYRIITELTEGVTE